MAKPQGELNMARLLVYLPSLQYASAGHKPLAATQAEAFHDIEEVLTYEDQYGTDFMTPTPLKCAA
jgi:hypothetical protein